MTPQEISNSQSHRNQWSTTMSKTNSPFLNQHVLVRTFSAGVHIGTLITKDETNAVLKDARRIWKWTGAFTLSEVAIAGIKKSGSRLSIVVPMIELTQAIELIPTSDIARKSFDAVNE
jgi:small nuclear ribonucleoprotein (snRNP)-like protein